MIVEGGKVSYVGDGEYGLQIGDRGKVLVDDGRACHVHWLTGAAAGNTLFMDHFDLVADLQDDGDESESLVHVAVKDVYDRKGNPGLLRALEEDGALAVFEAIASEAIELVGQRIRTDLAFGEVLARLGYDDAEEFVDYASRTLLSEAFGGIE